MFGAHVLTLVMLRNHIVRSKAADIKTMLIDNDSHLGRRDWITLSEVLTCREVQQVWYCLQPVQLLPLLLLWSHWLPAAAV
jgi:hypothetical protein